MTKIFLLACLKLKSSQSDEEWHLFYCNTILCYRGIQGFGLCKLDDL